MAKRDLPPELSAALRLAWALAARLGHACVGTEHLLLALAMQPQMCIRDSGSPMMSCLPVRFRISLPFSSGAERNESCFSAVTPVSGWNQWV